MRAGLTVMHSCSGLGIDLVAREKHVVEPKKEHLRPLNPNPRLLTSSWMTGIETRTGLRFLPHFRSQTLFRIVCPSRRHSHHCRFCSRSSPIDPGSSRRPTSAPIFSASQAAALFLPIPSSLLALISHCGRAETSSRSLYY